MSLLWFEVFAFRHVGSKFGVEVGGEPAEKSGLCRMAENSIRAIQ
jgi:hypothetical protein